MANIKIAGVTYTDITKISCKKTSGGNAVFIIPSLQEKTVSVSTSAVSVTPDAGYDGLSKVTVEGYAHVTAILNASSTGCSSAQLVVSCPNFTPSAIAVVRNSSTNVNNTIIAAWGMVGAYCTICEGTASSSKYPIVRTETTTGYSDYWYYSGGKVYIKRPPAVSGTTYSWGTMNYRVMIFK